MRSGWLVVGAAALIGVIVGVFSLTHTSRRVSVVQDIFTGLTYFLEDHDGRFPASEDEFLASPFVERAADGGWRVLDRPGDAFGRQAVGIRVTDLARYEIPWGVDLATLTVDRDGAVRDADGAEVLLLRGGPPLDAVRRFSRDLLRVAATIRESATSTTQPSGQ